MKTVKWMPALVVLYFILPSLIHHYSYWEASWYAFGWGGSYQRTWSLSSPILYLMFSILSLKDFLYYTIWFLVPLLLLVAMAFETRAHSQYRALGCALISFLLMIMHLSLLGKYYMPSLYGILTPIHVFHGVDYYEQLIPIRTGIIVALTFFTFKNWREVSHMSESKGSKLEKQFRRKSIVRGTFLAGCILLIVLIGIHCYQMESVLGVQQNGITAVVAAPFASTRYTFVVFGSVDEDKLGPSGQYGYAGYVTVAYVVRNVTYNSKIPWIGNLTGEQIQFNYINGPICSSTTTSSQYVPQPCFQRVIVAEGINSTAGPADAWIFFDSYGPANSSGEFFVANGKHLYFILATYVPIPILP